jgi:hypothetical protein
VIQKLQHFFAEALIAATFAREKSRAFVRWSFQRRVVEPLDLAPAFGVHSIIVLAECASL